ncbi:MAG: precorrin-4 C(11)-methyltransferase [Gemmataceae bacterium]
MSQPRIALIAVTRRGLEMSRRLRARLRAGSLFFSAKHGPPQHGWEQPFQRALVDQLGDLFASHEQLVFFLATGAVTRLIAPHLGSKTSDPGVLAIDEAGRFVVPVLSGHAGGANEFARSVAACLGAIPVITTASDVAGGFNLEQLAQDWGWRLEPAERIKHVLAALVNGEAVTIAQEIGAPGRRLDELDLPAHVTCIQRFEENSPGHVVCVADRIHARDDLLYLRPRSLVVGVGCERGITRAALDDGLTRFLAQHGYARASIAALATIEIKRDEQAITELAGLLDCEVVYFSAEELAAIDVPTPSAVVEKCVGAAGVAEPAALRAAHAGRLLVNKQVMVSPHATQRMTFALARSSLFTPPVANAGKVFFISAGPGDPELLTLKGRRLLARADVVVYAGSLVPAEILRQANPTAVLHNSASLTLEEISTILVDACRSGKIVARLHSGDTSIYSAIQEQMSLLDQASIDYEVIPGVSSFQAAAALLRSELTLPEQVQTVILTRGAGQTPMPAGEQLADLARHRATLCLFLSARLAERVQADLLTAYPPETPVAILHRVTWPDERIVETTLDQLAASIAAEGFTRTTLILVGQALGARARRSHLYDQTHGHLFRPRRRAPEDPPA